MSRRGDEHRRGLGPPRAPGPRAEPDPVLAVLGVLTSDLALGRQAAEQLAARRGGLGLSGEPKPFDQTRYYEPEMGAGLQRFYCCFDELAPATQLPSLKREAWQLEQQLSSSGQRTVNLDPGLLDLYKVVLASFKPGPQKLYLGQGVWADIVLYFDSGGFVPLRWTFPDLRGGDHLPLFAAARERYKRALRQRSP